MKDSLLRRASVWGGGREPLPALACAILGLGLLAFFVYGSQLRWIAHQRLSLREREARLGSAQVLLARLSEEARVFEDSRAHFRALERRIGKGESAARILEALTLMAQQHRLELVAKQLSAAKDPSGVLALGPEKTFRQLPLGLQLKGRYRYVGEFLSELSEAPFLAAIQELTLTKSPLGSAQLQADLVLAVYVAEKALLP